MRRVGWASGALLLLVASSAAAGEGKPLEPLPAPEPQPSEPLPPLPPPAATTAHDAVVVQPTPAGPVWYGWQTLVVDGAALTTLLASGAAKSNALGVLALTGYAIGPPIVHWAHHNVGIGFGSLGLRIVAPFAGAVLLGLTAAIASGRRANSDDSTVAAGIGLGFLLGYATTVVLDAALFSYEKPAPARPTSARLGQRGFTFAPTFNIAQDRASLGLGGTF
jgi:hypothetical protein